MLMPGCVVTEGDPQVLPEAEDSVWWREDGRMRCLASSVASEDPGQAAFGATRDEAVEAAAARLLPGAFEMLDRRGAHLGPTRRIEVMERFPEAVARGEEIEFPRIEVEETVVERCPRTGGLWRAHLLAEYPIGLLRGDVTHAQWERRRAERELEVRIRSANDLRASGRLIEAVLEMRRAFELGVWLGSVDSDPRLVEKVAAEGSAWTGRFGPELAFVDGAGALVMGVGDREAFSVSLTYAVDAEDVPAVGVPVSVAGGSLAWATTLAGVTDENGEVEIEVVAGTVAGQDTLEIAASFPSVAAVYGHWGQNDPDGVIARLRREVVVVAAGEATVCLEVDADTEVDAERVRDGMLPVLEHAGSRLAECGPDAALVVSVDVSLGTEETHGAWLTRVACSVRVFDQRVAKVTGETSFEVAESRDSSARDAEVLALREAGRLVGVYLEPRLAER